jgi:polyisoprenyl-teichoic acid--peptidoglycan teichoic acid transferase
MNEQKNAKEPSVLKKDLRFILWALLVVVGLVIAWNVYGFVSNLVASWSVTSLPGVAIIEPTPTPVENIINEETEEEQPQAAVPQASTTGPQAQPWDGASRVTVLLIGLDYSDWRGNIGPPLSDTMILLTIDPLTRTAGMLSIPRDMWVNIQGFDHGKINTAYQLGEAYQLPGGGPGLAMETVEGLIGVPIDYYAQVDFTAFVYFIDQMGGLKVDVPSDLRVDIYDDPKGKIWIRAGVQTMPGDHVLAYARARGTMGGDFDRAQRQQQVVMAIRQRILDFSLMPTFVQNAPEMYAQISSGINTNLSLDQVLQLAWLAQDIPVENITNRIIGANAVQMGRSPNGLEILQPIPDQIRIIRDEVFAQGQNTGPLAYEGMDALTLMKAEGASVKVLNGTPFAGLAGVTGDYLTSLGVNVVAVGDADGTGYDYTSVYDYRGKPYALSYFKELLGLNTFRIHGRYDQESDVDVTIILGADWANNNPMP